MHDRSLLREHEQKYQQAVIDYLEPKEKELQTVINELTYRSTLDDQKDALIKRLTVALSKIENEGCEVLAHVVRQNKKIKVLREKVEVEESDKVFLFSKAKEQLKLANGYQKVIKNQLLEISQLR